MSELTVDVDMSITAPQEIEVPLVRGDYLRMSDQYRRLFDGALALFSASLGAKLGGATLDVFGWTVLAVTALGGLIFLLRTAHWRKRAELTDGTEAE